VWPTVPAKAMKVPAPHILYVRFCYQNTTNLLVKGKEC